MKWVIAAAFVVNGVILDQSVNPTPFETKRECEETIHINSLGFPINWDGEKWVITVPDDSPEDRNVEVWAVCVEKE